MAVFTASSETRANNQILNDYCSLY